MNEKVEESQEQAADRPPIPGEQWEKILEAHRMWVESEGKEGERANLAWAYLHAANLAWAYLQEADLSGANLQGAILFGAKGLIASQVTFAENWKLAFYSDDFLKQLGLPPDHNQRLKKKLAELEKEKKPTGGK